MPRRGGPPPIAFEQPAARATPRRGRRAFAPRRAGLALAGVMALGSAGVIGYYALLAGPAQPPEPPPPDVTDIPVLAGHDPAGAGRGIVIQLAAREDPTKQVGELRADRYEPLENRRSRLERPQTFFFLDDGRTVYIRSDTATVFRPTEQSQPESGVFEGHGLAQVFEATPDGTRVDVLTATPSATARFDAMAFDSTLGELSTDGRVDFESPEAEGFFQGLRLYVDQVTRRPNLIEVFRGGQVRYRRAPTEPAPAPAPAPAPRPAGAAPAPGAPRPKPADSLYHAFFSGGVLVEQGTRGVTADTLDAWLRLRDNTLPPNAVARIDAPMKAAPAQRADARPAPEGAPGARPEPPAAAGEGAFFGRAPAPDGPEPAGRPGGAPEAPRDEPVVLTWDGPLVIRPLDGAPGELRRDHVTLRFRAVPDRGVVYTDGATGESARCRAFTYFATTRRAAAQGSGPGTVTYESAEVGSLAAGEVRADLSTGLVTVPTGGVVSDPGSDRTIAWSDRASVELERRPDGRSAVRAATFEGGVHAADGQSVVRGDFVMAEFATDAVPGDSAARERTWLRKVLVDGAAHAERAGSGWVSGDRLEAWFRPGEGGEADPTFVVATGQVQGREGPRRLGAGSLEAALRRAADGDVEVTQALARGGVEYREEAPGRPPIEATADEVRADPIARVVDLFAAPGGQTPELEGPAPEGAPPAPRPAWARVASGATSVSGSQLRLDEAARRLWVFGAGRFDHDEGTRADGSRGRVVAATWTEEMTFDDLAGVVTAFGGVESTSADALNEETFRGHSLRIEITPLLVEAPDPTRRSGIDDPEPTVEVPTRPVEAPERRVLRAVATGAVLDRPGGGNATVQSRLYFPGTGEDSARRVERVLYLEGPRLEADDEAGFLAVPGAGRLLVLNRAGEDDAPPPGRGPDPGERASSLFDWRGRMRMERATGRVEMHDRVGVTHRLLDDGRTLVLECAHLVAHVREAGDPPGPPTPAGPRGELVSASADGGVFARSATREVVCSRFDYDAVAGVAQASGAAGEPVLYTDTATGTVTSVAALTWDLKRDRIELRGVGTIVAPR